MNLPNAADHGANESQAIRNQIIESFLAAGDAFVSGNHLSTQLGLSRTAIWKHIQALEAIGFCFESVTRMGYRMTKVPNLLLEPLLKKELPSDMQLGQRVVWRRSVDSTNVLAGQLAKAGAPHGTIVTALTQTGGRGRRGKPWFSPSEGLWFSILLNQLLPLRRAAELTLLTSVAVQRALKHQTGLPVQIKWPNDLLVHEKKICGILAEIRADGENVEYAVIGIGINTNIARADFPSGMEEIGTSVLAETDSSINHVALVAEVLFHLEPLYNSVVHAGAGFLGVIDEWRATCGTLGRPVRIQTPAGVLEGLAVDIDDGGVLYVRRADGITVPVHSGDVLFGR